MIYLLATRYRKLIAYSLSLIFYIGTIIPAYGIVRSSVLPADRFAYSYNNSGYYNYPGYIFNPSKKQKAVTVPSVDNKSSLKTKPVSKVDSVNIDGPSQPEMLSFKPAGTSDMVNLFTGDFSYNIPLLDVGGYPVNIFYDGGITMEQSASWVGLGWNINPGNINRNMRGVPDDFNGKEILTQKQNMKKNITWGFSLGADLELFGAKEWNAIFQGSVGASIGYSLNNYLGPAIDLGLKGTTSFDILGSTAAEKYSMGVSLGLSANLNSRSGMTLTPNISLSAKSHAEYSTLSMGVGLSTSYNSRSGIKSLQISEQMSRSYTMEKLTRKLERIQNSSSMSATISSSSISFVKPSYIPAMRPQITNRSGAGRFQLGGAMFGIYGSAEIEGYGQVSSIEPADQTLKKPMVGYIYAQNAKANPNAVMDFTRFNDQEVTPTTSIVSVPQYSFDVFSIQGEGTGGTIRAYRNDNGYVRDNLTSSKDKSWSAGGDIGIPGHVGANFNTVKTPSTIGEWNSGNSLRDIIGFSNAGNGWENVYFRNPGENTVVQPNQFDEIGGTDLVRYKLGGTNHSPIIETKLEKVNSSGSVIGNVAVQNLAGVSSRKKRTQVVNFLTAQEAANIGLNTKIKVYNSDPANFLTVDKKLHVVAELERVSEYREAHHISQINITEADGKRYIYDVPVYNKIQRDFSFTVGCSDCTDDVVPFSQNETDVFASPHINSGVGGKDGFVQTTETPPYAHSFLLGGLLSPDYVDVKGDGITEDDLGTSVKFNYSKLNDHRWRTPMTNGMANSNPGNLTEKRDDKALISWGERESWYLQSIESKTMIAFFTLEGRADGKGIGTGGEFANIDYGDNSMKRLKQIDLYNKADLKKNGLTGAKPVKTVHFGYNNSLCAGTPDNQSGGKLTLERIWFTYNGQNRANKNQYVFSYTKGAAPAPGENPSYSMNEADRWGNYKPHNDNPQGIKNRDYPYALQDKTKADQYANAWSLKKILLPSGGQMEIEYESDDYAFVQNRRAATMSEIIGFSSTNTNPTNNLYLVNGGSITENNYIFISVTEACSTKNEVYQKYLHGMNQLLVKLLVNMPKGQEYLTSYATIEDYDVYDGAGGPAIWIRMKMVEDKGIFYSPLSVTALEYLRERLPAQAFKAYDVTEGTALDQLGTMFNGLIEGIKTTFSRIPQYLREKEKAKTVQLNKSFARLNDADGYKYGGGYRVKKVMLKDNWDRMTNQFGSTYGQEYNYTTKETFNGTERTTSSGVASYEPSIGGEENPFQSIVQIANEVPLGPTSYGAIEMPVMDAFFPAPLVGYSKVTVTSIGKKQNPDPANKKTRSGVGRQVTEFYTAKDFPVYYDNTPLDPAADKQQHINPTLTFVYKYAFDSRAISQGFLVITNDMHGKMRSQTSYAENDPSLKVNYTENFYRNTGTKGLDEKFDFVHNALGGQVQEGNMGIDIELMTDTREFFLKSRSFEIQGQVDWIVPAPIPVWVPFVWPVVSESDNFYRAVTTTKVITYHAVLDSVLVIDKGSQVSTKNLLYDAETGQVIVNRTNNEFDKPIYSVNYPAYWAYSGMGLAYKNIDAVYSSVNFLDGKIVSGISIQDQEIIFESGDELYIINAGSTAGCDPVMASPGDNGLIWAVNKNKDVSSLTDTDPDLIFIDKTGKPYSRSDVKFRIVRSGKRNVLSASVAAATVMASPIVDESGIRKLRVTNSSKVVNASAIEYQEKWQTDNDVFYKYRTEVNPVTCEVTVIEDCSGYLEKSINPYRKGLLGYFRTQRDMVFYGDRAELIPAGQTNLPQFGFLTGFNPYWSFNNDKNLVPDPNNTKWVWNMQSTRFNSKGMELETKDALEIFTGAQYGYQKTLPVAIANNSRYDQMMNENFEDYDYAETLNAAAFNSCAIRHVDFSGLENTEIKNTASSNFNAHTGSHVLQVNGSTATKIFPVSPAIIEQFPLDYEPDAVGQYNDPGGNLTKLSATPANAPVEPPTFTIGNFGMNLSFDDDVQGELLGGTAVKYYLAYKTLQYTKIETCQNYTFTLTTDQDYAPLPNPPPLTFNRSYITLTIKNLNNEVVRILEAHSDNSPRVFNDVFLTEGTYIFETLCTADIQRVYDPNNPITEFRNFFAHFNFTSNTGTTSYKSLSKVNTCPYTKPLAASESMMNPVFKIPPTQKMLFSAWVRESNSQQTTYTNNEVQIDFGSGNPNNITIKPAGPVIEGWQRYEGYFTAPGGVNQMTLRLVNNTGGLIYFDDLRIHPFNANMKTYVYDPVNLRLKAELDANNYSSFYEYDEEGSLVRTKAETREGVKTITESRSAKQKNITAFQ